MSHQEKVDDARGLMAEAKLPESPEAYKAALMKHLKRLEMMAKKTLDALMKKGWLENSFDVKGNDHGGASLDLKAADALHRIGLDRKMDPFKALKYTGLRRGSPSKKFGPFKLNPSMDRYPRLGVMYLPGSRAEDALAKDVGAETISKLAQDALLSATRGLAPAASSKAAQAAPGNPKGESGGEAHLHADKLFRELEKLQFIGSRGIHGRLRDGGEAMSIQSSDLSLLKGLLQRVGRVARNLGFSVQSTYHGKVTYKHPSGLLILALGPMRAYSGNDMHKLRLDIFSPEFRFYARYDK